VYVNVSGRVLLQDVHGPFFGFDVARSHPQKKAAMIDLRRQVMCVVNTQPFRQD
jgi:hypothetical protein